MRTSDNPPKQDWSSRLNSIALACMSNARRLLTWSLLTVYLSVSLFGELVHLLQCASCSIDAAVNSGCGSCVCGGHSPFAKRDRRASADRVSPVSVGSDRAAKKLTACVSEEPLSEDETPEPAHDSDQCAVCRILSIARDRAPLLVAVASFDSVAESLVLLQESTLSFAHRDAASRGPPVSQLS